MGGDENDMVQHFMQVYKEYIHQACRGRTWVT